MSMKKEFAILKNRSQLQLRLARDSVCAGDDCDAHEKTVSVYSFLDPVALVSHLAPGYLPTVNGYGHTWDCILNGKIIAIVSVNGIEAKVSEVTYAENNEINFVYRSAKY
jgi:hypothetical protein